MGNYSVNFLLLTLKQPKGVSVHVMKVIPRVSHMCPLIETAAQNLVRGEMVVLVN